MRALELLFLWMALTFIATIFGAAFYGGINLVAPMLHLPGGRGPWDVVLSRGAQIGCIAGVVAGGIATLMAHLRSEQ